MTKDTLTDNETDNKKTEDKCDDCLSRTFYKLVDKLQSPDVQKTKKILEDGKIMDACDTQNESDDTSSNKISNPSDEKPPDYIHLKLRQLAREEAEQRSIMVDKELDRKK